MAKYSLTTARKVIIDPTSVDRRFLLSVGLFSTAVAVYIAIGQGSDVDLIHSSGGTTLVIISVPAGATVEAWTDAGTAEIATLKQGV